MVAVVIVAPALAIETGERATPLVKAEPGVADDQRSDRSAAGEGHSMGDTRIASVR
jgi:hypothetical protein